MTGGAALKTYLASLTPGDLVVAGTVFFGSADSALNTSAIGGTDYTQPPFNTNPTPPIYPKGYMAIGAVNAAPGSAYENYASNNGQTQNYFAYGMLTEDSFGSYSFQSSAPIEYIVSPNDPVYNTSVVKIAVQPQFDSPTLAGKNYIVYSVCPASGCSASYQNGYYLLVVARDTLSSNPACTVASNPYSSTDAFIPGCGTFYPTGSSNFATATQAYQSLATALNNVQPGQLAFLTTIGTAAFANEDGQYQVAGTSNGSSYAYSGQFAPALENLGGTPKTTLFLYQANTAYTLVSSPGFGNSLTGDAVVSTSIDSAQGQTGYVHGMLDRDTNGLYRPGNSAQGETPTDEAQNTGTDYVIDKITQQQPVGWPELTGTLTGGSTASGMVSAYQYISYTLITNYYVKNAQGPYLDDIHYYFTGSNNTSIDYHTFDPVNLPYPGGSCFVWNDPVSNQALPCFTQADFSAVAGQVSVELVDLYNVLQFMVNGSTNMKDVIAGGNANVGLALTSATSTIFQSTLAPKAQTASVTLNLHKIFNLANKIVSLGVAVATDGLVPPGVISGGGSSGGGGAAQNGQPSVFTAIKKAVGLVKDISKVASAASGPFYTSTQTPTPTTNYKFTATVSQLANANLQGSMSIGFDTALDSIISDWGRLNSIGPQITDTNNPTFYSQNQVAQNASIALLAQGSQRGFFLALLPTVYSVQFWPSMQMNGTGNPASPSSPDMASIHSHTVGTATCNPFYPYTQSDPTTWSQWALSYPNYAGDGIPFQNNGFTNPYGLDWFIIAANPPGTDKSGSSTIQFVPPDAGLSSVLFSSTQLNLPQDLFIATANGNGPLPVMTYNAPTNVTPNLDYLGLLGFSSTSVGSNQNCQFNVSTDGAAPSLISTTTTYTGSLNAVIGNTLNLQAAVAPATGSAIPTGSIVFKDSGVTLGIVALDRTGKAALPTSNLSLGTHSIVAYYARLDPFDSSQTSSTAIQIYPDAPDMQLTASAKSLQVGYGTTSSAISLQVTSLSGLAGTVSFACAGLPIGMTCQFTPSTVTLTDGSNAASSVTISSSATTTAGVGGSSSISYLLVVILIMGGWAVGKQRRIVKLVCSLALMVFVACTGCNSSDSSTKPLQETGTKTILISATSGAITKAVPVTVTIQ